MLLGVGQVHGVDDQVDIGGVLTSLRPFWNLDQLDSRLVERSGVEAEPAPIGVSPFGDDFAFFHQALQYPINLEAIAPALEPQGQILEIDKNRQRSIAFGHNQLPVLTQPGSPLFV